MARIPVFLLITTITSIAALFNFWVFFPISSSPLNHRYNVGDQVPLFANKVGPLNNPSFRLGETSPNGSVFCSETYEYFDLPFCPPDKLIRRRESLGEVINGDHLTNTRYDIKFRENKVAEIVCTKTLGREEVVRFRNAIQRDSYFQMYYDDLLFWGFIGKVEGERLIPDFERPRSYLFTHVEFTVLYSGNHVIEVHAFSDPNHVVDITEDAEVNVQFTYSANWNATSGQFADRMNRYSRPSSLLPIQHLHWFSVINSIAIIMLSVGLLVILYWWNNRSDLRKYSAGEEDDTEVGWACIDGDVFGCPPFLSLFCAILGCGTQIFLMACGLFVLTSLGLLEHCSRGNLWKAVIFMYTMTSVIAGYTATSFHCQFSEAGWEKSVFLTGVLFTGPVFFVISILNKVAISYGAMTALPFGTIIVMLLIYAFITIPLLALGGILGHCYSPRNSVPYSKRCFREIPPLNWYAKIHSQMFLGGLLPFSGILVELHLFYASLWSHKLFTLPSILFITFTILVLLTVILSIGLTYIQLSMEDSQWCWRPVMRGGSTAIFMFIYSTYFYSRSDMSGVVQLLFFLGYNVCICYAFFLMLGTISFYTSRMFIYRIYHAVKSE